MAIVRLPRLKESGADDVVVLGRQAEAEAAGTAEAKILLLSPGEPVHDLRGLRAYLTRCRTRVQEKLKTPPH